MAKYYSLLKVAIGFVLLANIATSCNKESFIEGVEDKPSTKVTLNQTVNLGVSTNINLNVDGTNLSVPISFTLTPITATTGTFRIITNSYSNFRWAYDVYLRKYSLGEAISGNDFVVGGTNYIVNAIRSSTGTYSYQYNKSCIVNQENYIVFKYTKTLSSGEEKIYLGWINFTPRDNQVVFNTMGYVENSALSVGK